tara:strand:- start:707 stop:1213 length:507 start_codon:yes stop_codon:yes gene_type:complete
MGSNSSTGGSSDSFTNKRSQVTKVNKSPIEKAVDLYTKYSPVVNVAKMVSTAFKNEKNLKEAKKEDALGGEMLTRERRSVSIAGGSQRGNDNSNVVVQAPTVSGPTTAEVSQTSIAATPEITSEEARDSANLLLKKRRGRGRSQTILTSAQGVQKNEGLTLGKPSLLG